MERNLRKYQNNLYVAGFAVLVLAAWGWLKGVISISVMPVSEFGADELGDNVANIIRILITAIIAVILLVAFLLRLYISRCASAEGKGKKKGYVYIVFAMIIAAVDIYSLIATWTLLRGFDIFTSVISSLLDIMSVVVLFDVIYSSIRVKKLTKALAV